MGASVIVAGALCLSAAVVLALAPLPAVAPRARGAHPERGRLVDAGWRWSAARWELARALSAVSAAVLAGGAGLPAALGAVTGVALPSVALALRASARRRSARRAATAVARTVHAAIVSGATVPDALRRAVDATADAIATRPLREALARFATGEALDAALVDARTGDARHDALMTALAIAVRERLASERIAPLLARVVDRLAAEDALADEVHARTSGVRAQIWVLAIVVPAIAAYLYATVPTMRASLDDSIVSKVLVPIAVALEVGGIALTHRLAKAPLET